MAPSHDPFAPSGPRRSGLLPPSFERGARSAGASDEEMTAIRGHWWKGNNDQRAEATRIIEDLTDAEWVEFLEAWRSAMADPTFSPWSDDDDQEATSDASEAQDTPPADSAATGGDGPDGVQVSLLGPDGTIIDPDALGELVDMGPAPEGWVEAGWMRPTGEDLDGEPVGIGMRGFVPADAKAAAEFITTPADGGDPGDVVGRARLVLAAELDRAPGARRKRVLAAVTEHLGDDEVAEQSRLAGEGLGG